MSNRYIRRYPISFWLMLSFGFATIALYAAVMLLPQ